MKDNIMNDLEANLKTLDETEDISILITDDLLQTSKIRCYNYGLTKVSDNGKEIPINPKKCPEKAVLIMLNADGILIDIFFSTKLKKWDSRVKIPGVTENGKLPPDQMAGFFMSKFYDKMLNEISKKWPLSDQFHKELFDGLVRKEFNTDFTSTMSEDDEDEETEEKTKTGSGRKIVHFSDNLVSAKSVKFYCWPNIKDPYRWSQWKDYKKITPLCRIRFKHGQYEYGLSLNVVDEQFKNRGFKGYNLTLEPHLQWLTFDECESAMKLSIVNKFIAYCKKRIRKFTKEDPKSILKKMNNPDKITLKEIEKTQSMIKNTLVNIIENSKADTFIWENDKVIECDGGGAGAAVGGEIASGPVADASSGEVVAAKPSGSISVGDVLGKDCDHEKHGYLGPGCFHVPSKVMNPLKRFEIPSGKKKKGLKNFYVKGMKVIQETNLTKNVVMSIHNTPEINIIRSILNQYPIDTVDKIIGICYFPYNRTFFVKFMSGRKTLYAQMKFDNRKFEKFSDYLYTSNEAKDEYVKLSSDYDYPEMDPIADMGVWIVRGRL